MLLLAVLLATMPTCGGSRPTGCANASALIDHGLPERLRQFFGGERAAYLYNPLRLDWTLLSSPPWRSRTIADQVLTLLGGPSEPRVALPGEYYFFAACRQRSCTERGGLIVDRRGRILVVAIVHYRAGRADAPHLAVYAREGLPRPFITYVTDWAHRIVAPRRISQRIVTRV